MRGRRYGFTLIEMLLALALTSLLTAALSMMIGQAARDRHELEQQDQDPVWLSTLFDAMERDLRQARWWASNEGRLVLIGMGRNGMPAQIEYRWIEHESTTIWTRKEESLVDGVSRDDPDEQVLAVGLNRLQVGPHLFGQAPNEPAIPPAQPINSENAGAPVLLIEGQQIPLASLPARATVELVFGDGQTASIQREVLLW